MDVTGSAWRKSSYSGSNGGNCVQVARNLPGVVAVRDSKDPGGPILAFGSASWRAFRSSVSASLTRSPMRSSSSPAGAIHTTHLLHGSRSRPTRQQPLDLDVSRCRPAAASSRGRGRIRARTGLRLGRRLLRSARGTVVLGRRTLGAAAARAGNVGETVLGTLRARVSFPSRVLAVMHSPSRDAD